MKTTKGLVLAAFLGAIAYTTVRHWPGGLRSIFDASFLPKLWAKVFGAPFDGAQAFEPEPKPVQANPLDDVHTTEGA